MIIEVKDLSQCLKEISISIPAEKALADYHDTLKYFKNNVVVPGYRKGKAPLSKIDGMFADKLRSSYLQDKIPVYLEQAFDDKGLIPLYEPNIKDVEWEKGKDLVLVVQFEVQPTLDVKKYTGLDIPYTEIEFEESMIMDTLKRIRDEQASAEKVDDGAVKGDFLRLDVTFTDSDNSPEKVDTQLSYVMLFENSYGDSFNEALAGKRESDVVETVAKLGEGKEYPVSLKILEHRRLVKADIDEEFAKKQGHESLADFKELLRSDISKQIMKRNQEHKLQATFMKLMEENPFDVPATLVLEYSRKMAEPYAQYYNKPVEELAKEYYGPVSFDIKRLYLMKELKNLISVEITEEDKENMVSAMASEIELSIDEYKEKNPDVTKGEDFVNKIIEKKIIDHLYTNNTFVKVESDPEAEEADVIDADVISDSDGQE